MKPIIAALVLLTLATPVFALTVADLPHLEGTPLTATQDNIPVWTVLDHQTSNDTLEWVWLDQAGYSAYLVYPSANDVTLPDNTTIPAHNNLLTLRLVGENQEYTITRFGGEILMTGEEITLRYSVGEGFGVNEDGYHVGDVELRGEDITFSDLVRIKGEQVRITASRNIVLGGSINADVYIYAENSLGMEAILNNGNSAPGLDPISPCPENNAASGGTVSVSWNAHTYNSDCFGVVNIGDTSLFIGNLYSDSLTVTPVYAVDRKYRLILGHNNPVSVNPQQFFNDSSTEQQTSNSDTKKSKGGSLGWFFIIICMGLAISRRPINFHKFVASIFGLLPKHPPINA